MTLPALFDFQINGFAGIDFQGDDLTAGALRTAVDALRADGVGGIFLTLITDREETLCRRFERLERFRLADPVIAAMVRGYHLEGPWLRPEVGYCGAHPPEAMVRPTLAAWERLQSAAGGNIRLLTLAPELPGSNVVIAAAAAQGVHVAIGHSNASDSEIDHAIMAGARFATHLGNGVPGVLPRHDNVIQRLLARDELYACFIPDGIHLPPFVLRNFVRAKPAGKVLFTTDAMAAAGAPAGEYRTGGKRFRVGPDRIVRDTGPGGGFAGSALAPSRGVELTAHYLGLTPGAARDLWSRAPLTAFNISLVTPALLPCR